MNVNKKPMALFTVCGLKGRIDSTPDYQRPPVWSKTQKRLLIDTILRGYDVPKFYWRKVESSPDKYEVVDGQQRLRAIWEYQAGDFKLASDADSVNGMKVAGLSYDDLPLDLRTVFDGYTLDIVILENADEDEVREMFLRLQNGTSLTAQEKRNAMPGEMRDFVKDLAQHPFFANVNFSNKRFAHAAAAAQITLLELKGGPANIKNVDLDRMYKENIEFNAKGPKAFKIRRVLDYMIKMFSAKTPELERYSFISLFMLVSGLLERYVVQDRHEDLARWFINFEKYRREQYVLPSDQCDPEILSYQEKIGHSTDSIDSLRFRYEYLIRKMFEAVPDILLKDDQRLFTHDQRLAIFRRDGERCQVKLKCSGDKCEWDNWEADHIIAWNMGGKTTVSNGQVACPLCNASKGDRAIVAA